MYVNLRAKIVGAEHMEPIVLNKGVKQGCPASPLLFGLYFEQVEKRVK